MNSVINPQKNFWGFSLLLFLCFASPISVIYSTQEDVLLDKSYTILSDEELLQRADEALKEEDTKKTLVLLDLMQKRGPSDINTRLKIAYFYILLGHLASALEIYFDIVKSPLDPNSYFTILYNAACVLKTAGHFEPAVKIFKRILEVAPAYGGAHLSLAFSLISQAKFKEGWIANEWNLVDQKKNAPELCKFLAEGTLQGKTILLIPEGGLGDTLMFIRYGQQLKKLGAHVIGLAPKPLYYLFANNRLCFDQVILSGTAIPPHDARATYMSLPTILHNYLDTFDYKIQYIFPHPQLVAKWKTELANDKKFKVGICWQSDVKNDESRLPMARRGIPLKLLESLAQIPNVSFYSLQQKDGLDGLHTISPSFKVHTFDDGFDKTFGGFMDTAALIENLDLVIAIDSAVAHLAGAICKPDVWLLLPYSTDWRWTWDSTKTAWYPTMTVFRQPYPFDWQSVVDRLNFELRIRSQYKRDSIIT